MRGSPRLTVKAETAKCGKRQAYEIARHHPCYFLAEIWRTAPESTKQRVCDVVEFKPHRKGRSWGEYSGISRTADKKLSNALTSTKLVPHRFVCQQEGLIRAVETPPCAAARG